MIRNTLILVVAVTAVSVGQTQTGGVKKVDPNDAELTFANGSVVRMTLLPNIIEVETQFGKLNVPFEQIRRIEFGLHLPEGADKKIAAAIKKLASAQYREREEAGRELVELGIYAYPALIQAAKHADPETTKRAQDAINKIKTNVSAKDLALGDDDKIVTPRFTIVGRITTPTIKAKSEYFGDVDHALAKLRHVRVLGTTRGADVAIDAAKYAQSSAWLDTGILLQSTSSLLITASGEVELRPTLPGTYVSNPKGYNRTAALNAGFGGQGKKVAAKTLTRTYPGTLMGRIGTSGESFIIGEHFEGYPEREGKLYLQIVPSPYEEASTGSYHAKVVVRE